MINNIATSTQDLLSSSLIKRPPKLQNYYTNFSYNLFQLFLSLSDALSQHLCTIHSISMV